MSLQYVKSKKGRDQLLYKGYLHTKERVFGNKTVWKCANYHRDRCPGRAHTLEDRVVKYSAHRHPPRKAAREAKRTEHSTEATHPSGPQLTHKVDLPDSGGLPETIPTKKPRTLNPKQTIQRLKACLNACRRGNCNSRTSSATVAESVPDGPSSAVPVTPPNLHERSKDGNFTAVPTLCEEPEASHSVLQATWEARRQRFRSGTAPSGANPREILSCISEAARQWLHPQEHDKDQIVDMVILEQFLAVLPMGMQVCVKAEEPSSSMEAVRLAETYLEHQEPFGAGQELKKDLITFEDVSLRFSEEEWTLLDQEQKALYWNVMHQNCENVAWLSWETCSKGEEDPWLEAPESAVDLLKNSNKEISWSFKQNERRQGSSSEEDDDARTFVSDLKETTRDAELGLETRCACCSCGEADEPSSLVSIRKSHREEDSEPIILSGEFQDSSEKKIPKNPEENLIKEGQTDAERQQSNNPGMEENLIPFREALRDHQDSRPGQETPCIAADGGEQDESLALLHDQTIYIEDDFECVPLPEGSLFISLEGISQSPEENSQAEPIHIYSLSELNRIYSQVGVDGTAALTSQKTIVLDRLQISSPEKEGREETSVLSGNGLPELRSDLLFLHAQPTPEPQPTGLNPEESSEYSSSQKRSQGEDLSEGPSHKRPFIPSSASTTQPNCSDSEGNSGSLSGLRKHRRFDKKRKLCSRRNLPVRSVLGTQQRLYPGGKLRKRVNLKDWWASRKWGCRFPELQGGLRAPWKHSPVNMNTQPPENLQMATETTSEAASSSDSREAQPWQKAPSPAVLDKVAAEPIVAQLMAVLEQMAADTVEIKSSLSRLHPTMASIQNALGNLSGCTDDAKHRISDLEFSSQNTKAQLVQHCNDIKAIEAKVVGKAVQTSVIAGLWPSLGIKREMSP